MVASVRIRGHEGPDFELGFAVALEKPVLLVVSSVESTMRTGYEKGYQVVTLSDCVAATSPEEHDNAIRFDYPIFSQPMSADEFTAGLAGEREKVDASLG